MSAHTMHQAAAESHSDGRVMTLTVHIAYIVMTLAAALLFMPVSISQPANQSSNGAPTTAMHPAQNTPQQVTASQQ